MGEKKLIEPVTSEDIIDLVLDENQIEKNNIPHEELFYLKFDTKILGPVWSDNLNQFLEIHDHLIDDDVMVRSFEGSDWSLLFEHPRFSRRRPQVVEEDSLSNIDKLYVLQHGVPKGPFALNKIRKKIQKNEILLTDMISEDGGETWNKIYKYDIFNRRAASTSLPTSPEEIPEVTESIPSPEIKRGSSLANLYKVTPKIEKKKEEVKVVASTPPSHKLKYTWMAVAALIAFVFLFIVISDSLVTPDLEEVSPAQTKTKTFKQKTIDKEMTPTKTKSSFTTKKVYTKPQNKYGGLKRRPAYKKSIFKKEKVSGETRNSWVKGINKKDHGYTITEDDGVTPHEQDPIRSKLSRKSLEEDYDGEMESEDIVHGDRDSFLDKLRRVSEESDLPDEDANY